METEYTCSKCNEKTVVVETNNDWKVFSCTSCKTKNPLSIEDLIKESSK